MNELQIFRNQEFGEVRTIEIGGKPYFVGKDIAEILGYSNPRKAIIDHVDEEDKGVTKCDTLGGTQELTVINESGLYCLILSSKMPNAKKFKHWVTSEVLPTIRKHGAYMTPEKIEEVLLNPDTIIKLATELKEEKEKRLSLEEKVEADKPKTIFADAVAASDDLILVGELAKIIKQNGQPIGQNRLFKWLRDNNYLINRKGTDYNMPTQKSMELGVFRIKERAITNPDGSIRTTKTVLVTGKGQQYFVNKFMRAEAI